MFKVFANFLLAITSMSVPVAAGSFMHVYTEDKKPTSFEELKFQTITEIPDEEEDEAEEEDKEDDDADSTQVADNSAGQSSGGTSSGTTNSGSSTSSAGSVKQPTVTPANGGTTSSPKTASSPKPAPAPKPVPVPPQQPVPSPVPPQQPASPQGSSPQPGTAPGAQPNGGTDPSASSKDGNEITIETLKYFINQETQKHAGDPASANLAQNWTKIIEALSKFPANEQKALLGSFQLS